MVEINLTFFSRQPGIFQNGFLTLYLHIKKMIDLLCSPNKTLFNCKKVEKTALGSETKKSLSISGDPSEPYTVKKLSPARESLESDIPAGNGNVANLFLQCKLNVTSLYQKAVFNLYIGLRELCLFKVVKNNTYIDYLSNKLWNRKLIKENTSL